MYWQSHVRSRLADRHWDQLVMQVVLRHWRAMVVSRPRVQIQVLQVHSTVSVWNGCLGLLYVIKFFF